MRHNRSHLTRLTTLILLVTALAALTLPSTAQQARGDAAQKQRAGIVENLNLAYTPETGLILTMSLAQPSGCDTPLTIQQEQSDTPGVLFIDLEPDAAAATGDTACSSPATPREVEVQVDATFANALLQGDQQTMYLIVNNSDFFGVPVLKDEQNFGDPVRLRRDNVEINSVVMEPAEGGYTLKIDGMHLSTCMAPDIVRQTIDAGTVKLEIFQLIAPGTRCPQTLIAPFYKATLPLEMPEADAEIPTLTGIYVINVNGYQFTYDFDAQAQGPSPMTTTVVDHLIDSAEVLILESMPPQLVLHVIGSQPDGCQFPVEVVQTQEGNTVTVHIFRNVPDNVRCMMSVETYDASIPLGTFQPGEYTIIVNGTEVKVSL